MKAAVDTNVLFDLLAGDPTAAAAAEQSLSDAIASGQVVLCPVVYAELAAGFDQPEELSRFLLDLGLQLEAFSPEALSAAAAAWRSYTRRRGQQVRCPRCGHGFDLVCPACQSPVAGRQHLIADFLVGGHAVAQAQLLITRDVGYYRRYFPQLQLVPPPAASSQPQG